MKRLLIILLYVFALQLHAQNTQHGNVADIDNLVETFKKIIPYRDTANNITIRHVFANHEYHYLKLSVNVDSGLSYEEYAAKMLFLLTRNGNWDLSALPANNYSLRVFQFIDKCAHGGNLEFQPDEIKEAIEFTPEREAMMFLQAAADEIQADLPIDIEDGEYVTEYRFYPEKHLQSLTHDLTPEIWANAKEFIQNHSEALRSRIVHNYLNDSPHMVWAIRTADITIRHLYRNQAHTDSLELFIAPWMWEHIIAGIAAGSTTEQEQAQTIQEIQNIADEMNAICPFSVDSLTVLTNIVFDADAKTLQYNYAVPEIIMLTLEHSQDQLDILRENVLIKMQSEEASDLAALLRSAGVTLIHTYTSQRSPTPLTIVISPEQLLELNDTPSEE